MRSKNSATLHASWNVLMPFSAHSSAGRTTTGNCVREAKGRHPMDGGREDGDNRWMPQELRHDEPAARGRATLPDPFYYLNNFQAVLSSIEARYAQLLSLEERQFIACFRALPGASRALLVRMVMRQGALFRSSRLHYREIGAPPAAAAPLVQLGWVDETPDLDVDRLQALLSKA